MAAAYPAPTVYLAWEQFMQERSAALCATSIASDYQQVSTWLKRSPHQQLDAGRELLTWVLTQDPRPAARRVGMYVKAMYRWASSPDVGLLALNPVASFQMPKRPQRTEEIRVIPRNEMRVVLTALREKLSYRGVDWSVFAEFMVQTGLRTGEVRACKWDDIRDDRIYVHSNYTLTHGHKGSTKTNQARWVPLNARAQELLEHLPRTDSFIFPWSRTAFQSYFTKRMKQLHEQGLIQNRYRPYDLRHSAISRWLESGVPVTQAAQWAGNTSEVIWKHYASITQSYEMPVF